MAKYLIEADGGSRGNPGIAGSGTVIYRQGSSEPLAEISYYISDSATNNYAEYHGLIIGLYWLLNFEAGAEIQVKMDSKLVVEQMSGRWKIKNPDMQKLALKGNNLLNGNKIEFNWIPRLQNSAADSLANKAMDSRSSTFSGELFETVSESQYQSFNDWLAR